MKMHFVWSCTQWSYKVSTWSNTGWENIACSFWHPWDFEIRSRSPELVNSLQYSPLFNSLQHSPLSNCKLEESQCWYMSGPPLAFQSPWNTSMRNVPFLMTVGLYSMNKWLCSSKTFILPSKSILFLSCCVNSTDSTIFVHGWGHCYSEITAFDSPWSMKTSALLVSASVLRKVRSGMWQSLNYRVCAREYGNFIHQG